MADGTGLFNKTYDEWLAQSSRSEGTINDVAHEALVALVGLTGSLNDLMYRFLTDLGYTGALNDMLAQWDGTFSAGADALILETGDYILLETGDKLLLE